MEQWRPVIKTVTLLTRRKDLSPEGFHRYWRDVHAPLVAAIPGVRKYVQGRVIAAEGASPGYDGVAEVYYDDIGSMRAAFATEEYAALLADEVNFMGPQTRDAPFVFVEEDRMV